LASDEQTELLREMRDLLLIMAEPALAERDKRLRAALTEVVGKNRSKARAVLAMDGSRSQSAIHKEGGIDQGNLSRLVKALRNKSLLVGNDKNPKLAITVPSNFFEGGEN